MSLYDQVEYPGSPFPQTHPDRLATVAALHGLAAPPIATCRVLELGCGDGGNLIPMALTLPGAHFTGIDLAPTGIATGNRTIAALGLTNITLRAADLLQVDASWGEFDYIITHGLYAWVPAPVREQILRISKQNLAPEGIAYISYNALPGSRIRQMLREMMLFHAQGFDEPGERVEQAQGLLAFVASASNRPSSFIRGIDETLNAILAKEPWSVFHDELANVYEPFYFHQFMAAAQQHALGFLAEADFADLSERRLTSDAVEQIDAMAGPFPDTDRVLREQYADFANGRAFRQTLLVHAGRRAVAPPTAQSLAPLYASTSARQTGHGTFEAGKGGTMNTDHPLALAMMATLLAAAPQTVPVQNLGGSPEILLGATFSGITQLHSQPRPLVVTPGPKPVASPLARFQAARDLPITTLFHTSIRLEDPVNRELLLLLDGTHSIDELASIPDIHERVVHLGSLGLLTS